MSYIITGKLVEVGEIIGLYLTDDTGKELLLSYKKSLELISSGSVPNWEIVKEDTGDTHLYSSTYSLSNIPTRIKEENETFHLIGKVVKGLDGEPAGPDSEMDSEMDNSKSTSVQKVVGYTCTDESGEVHRYRPNKFWNLVKAGKVESLIAMKSSTNRIIKSDDTINLKNLEEVKI